MRRCQSADGLRTDRFGWTLPSWTVDERLGHLAVFGGNDNDAKRTAALMIRQVWENGVPRPLTPEDIEDADDTLVVILARFMHQDVDVLESRPRTQLLRWYDKLMEILKAQNGSPDPND